jgi:hypothetical protein
VRRVALPKKLPETFIVEPVMPSVEPVGSKNSNRVELLRKLRDDQNLGGAEIRTKPLDGPG